jgi:hypothetical protein
VKTAMLKKNLCCIPSHMVLQYTGKELENPANAIVVIQGGNKK